LHSVLDHPDEESFTDNLADGTWNGLQYLEAVRADHVDRVIEWQDCLSPDRMPGHHMSCAPMLEAVLRRHPHVRLVFASDWRKRPGLAATRSLLPPFLAARVVGETRHVKEVDANGRTIFGIRSKLARELLDASGLSLCTPWLAIDDVRELWDGDEARLVKPKSAYGLQPAEMFQLDALLHQLGSNAHAIRIRRSA
jgi:hypothetical protein